MREHRKHERKDNCESKSSRRGKVRNWQEVRKSVDWLILYSS